MSAISIQLKIAIEANDLAGLQRVHNPLDSNYWNYNSIGRAEYKYLLLYLAIINDADNILNWVLEKYGSDLSYNEAHRFCLREGMDINSGDPTITPLSLAIDANAVKAVKILRAKGAKLTSQPFSYKNYKYDDDFDLLFHRTNVSMLDALFQNYSDDVDSSQNKLLHYALKYQPANLELIRELLSKTQKALNDKVEGVFPRVRPVAAPNMKNAKNQTPMDIFLEKLKNHTYDEKYLPMFDLLLSYEFDGAGCGAEITSAQYQEIMLNAPLSFVSKLLSKRIPPEAFNDKGDTTLDLFIRRSKVTGTKEEWLEFTTRFIKVPGFPQNFMTKRTGQAKTPIASLLEQFNSIERMTSQEKTNSLAVLDLLLQTGVVVSREDFKNLLKEPRKNQDVIMTILDHNPQLVLVPLDQLDTKTRTWQKDTALHVFLAGVKRENYAASYQTIYSSILNYMLDPGEKGEEQAGTHFYPDVNAENKDHLTPLEVYLGSRPAGMLSAAFLLPALIKAGTRIKGQYFYETLSADTYSSISIEHALLLSGVLDFSAFSVARDGAAMAEKLFKGIMELLKSRSIPQAYITRAFFLKLVELYYAKRNLQPEEKHNAVTNWALRKVATVYTKTDKLAAAQELRDVITRKKQYVDRIDVVQEGELGQIYLEWTRYASMLQDDASLTPPQPTKLQRQVAGNTETVDVSQYRTGNVTLADLMQVQMMAQSGTWMPAAAMASTQGIDFGRATAGHTYPLVSQFIASAPISYSTFESPTSFPIASSAAANHVTTTKGALGARIPELANSLAMQPISLARIPEPASLNLLDSTSLESSSAGAVVSANPGMGSYPQLPAVTRQQAFGGLSAQTGSGYGGPGLFSSQASPASPSVRPGASAQVSPAPLVSLNPALFGPTDLRREPAASSPLPGNSSELVASQPVGGGPG